MYLDALTVVISVLGTFCSIYAHCASVVVHTATLSILCNSGARWRGGLGRRRAGDERCGNRFGFCWLNWSRCVARAVPYCWSGNRVCSGFHRIRRVDVERDAGLFAGVGSWEGHKRCCRWGDSTSAGDFELSAFGID